jgi:GNAT superfamily N-acetyltransferase
MTDSVPPSDSLIRLESEADAMKAVQQAVLGGLLAYNREQAGEPDQVPVVLSVRDAEGAVIAGLIGATAWRWLVIALLWVDAAHRRRGHGRALLRAAEAEARRRGCGAVLVDTLDFQAPGLYEREGYQVFGTLEGFPPGHRRLYFHKRLSAAA